MPIVPVITGAEIVLAVIAALLSVVCMTVTSWAGLMVARATNRFYGITIMADVSTVGSIWLALIPEMWVHLDITHLNRLMIEPYFAAAASRW
jgi:hypothetical protein